MRQALFVDSKAEKVRGERTATIQTAQTSMTIKQYRQGLPVEQPEGLPVIAERGEDVLLTTTAFVKYNYLEREGPRYDLASITIVGLPNGMLQQRYNPTPSDGFWLAGRNAPSRGEAFRVWIGLAALKEMASWRVQRITILPAPACAWDN
mgnify:CR=1 FL=1